MPEQSSDMPQVHPVQKTPKKAKRFVVGFFAISALLTFAIVVLSLVKTTITIERSMYPIRSEFKVLVTQTPQENDMQGTVTSEVFTKTEKLEQARSSTTVSGNAQGKISIVNHWNQTQPLQAGTRFTTTTGILFRSTERVDVPAGGEVQITIAADSKGKDGDIQANTRLTLPGLWEGLQDKIYATTVDDFSGGEKKISLVTDEDLTTLRIKAMQALDEMAKTESSKNQQTNIITLALRSETLLAQADAQAGGEASNVSFTVRARYTILQLDKEKCMQQLYSQLFKHLTDQEEITAIDMSTFEVTIGRINQKEKSAEISATVTGKAQLHSSANLLSPSYFTGKTMDELQKFADEQIGIKTLTARLSPFWAQKTPTSPSRISVVIK